jgi:Zn-dependent M28 family amino/carboxypeptidase
VGGGPPLFLVTPALAERLIGRRLGGARMPMTGLGTFRYALNAAIQPVEAWNVVGVVPGSDPARAGSYVALGAHYDHVGIGVAVNGDSIYNGADDDGSGTAALLEIAERFASLPQAQRPARSLLFVWHTGEEKGLLGSEAFTENATVPRDSIVAQLNVDMIGRNAPDSLLMVGSRRRSTAFGTLIETVNARQPRPFRFDYGWDAPDHPEHLYCRSDHYNYARFGIPVAFFTSGLHADYHAPSDEPGTLDYAKLARVTSLIGDVAGELAVLPAAPARDRPLPPIGEPCS